jgi:surface polysaccharide O-acyltransferase-like enzyme
LTRVQEPIATTLPPPVLAPGGATTAARSANLDRLRAVAIVDIVMFHADAAMPRPLLGVGLPVFLIASVFLSCRRQPPAVTGPTLQRVRHVLGPWVAWSAIYITFAVAVVVWTKGWSAWAEPIRPNLPLYGGSIHLWFLPFIVAADLIARVLSRLTCRLPTAAVAAPALAVGLTATWFPSPASWTLPYATWWFAWPCIPLGLALGRLYADGRLLGPGIRFPAAVTAALGLALLLSIGLSPPVGRYLAAIGLIVLCLSLPGRPTPATALLTSLIFGVYLSHPLLIDLLRLVYGFGPTPYWGKVTVGLVGGAAVTLCLRRFRATRWLVGA